MAILGLIVVVHALTGCSSNENAHYMWWLQHKSPHAVLDLHHVCDKNCEPEPQLN